MVEVGPTSTLGGEGEGRTGEPDNDEDAEECEVYDGRRGQRPRASRRRLPKPEAPSSLPDAGADAGEDEVEKGGRRETDDVPVPPRSLSSRWNGPGAENSVAPLALCPVPHEPSPPAEGRTDPARADC